MGARTWQLQVAVALVLLLGVADAKPTIQVETKIDPGDSILRARLALALGAKHDDRTPEQFITDEFLDAFEIVPVFSFVKTGAPEQKLELYVTSANRSRDRWPNANARIELNLDTGEKRRIDLFSRDGCSPAAAHKRCSPSPLTDPDWYAGVFGELIKQWPGGMFGSIVFSRQASYAGGIVRVPEKLENFGAEHDNGDPKALFQIVYGEIQRQVSFCEPTQFGSLARDQAWVADPMKKPSCAEVRIPSPPAPGNNGRITLLKYLVDK